MTFNSLAYFLFVPVVFLVWSLACERLRWVVLLAASYLFYASFNAPYLLVALLLVTCASYACGILIQVSTDERRRKIIFWAGVTTNLLVLASLKYIPFPAEAFTSASGQTLLAIGVSYYVFQAISYLIDISLEIAPAERHFGRFALYLAFFPKLLQGPIERSNDLLPQLHITRPFDYYEVREGMILFAGGFFKKVVIADRLALFVDNVYGDVHAFTGLNLLLATYFYAIQIYADFSGYTDMALGTARLFGIRLTPNFNSPYTAPSVAEFWRRWHISFSRWILDYLFKPMQMQFRRWGNTGTAAALLLTFLACGIWHGAKWGFVAWGVLHGCYLAISVFYRPLRMRLQQRMMVRRGSLFKAWQVVVTFHLVCLAWIFFRSETLSDAVYVITQIPSGLGEQLLSLFQGAGGRTLIMGRQSGLDLALNFVALGFMGLMGLLARRGGATVLFRQPVVLRWGFYAGVTVVIILFGVFGEHRFIYFKF